MGFRLKKRMGFQLPERPYRWRGKATLILLNYKLLTRPNPAITFPKGRPRNASGREKLSGRHPRSSAGPRRPTYPSRPGGSYFLASRSLNRSPNRLFCSVRVIAPYRSAMTGALQTLWLRPKAAVGQKVGDDRPERGSHPSPITHSQSPISPSYFRSFPTI